MSSSRPSRRRMLRFLGTMMLAGTAGCSSESGAPTKIYEGGGTIPEIVDQPEPAAPKGKPAKGDLKN